MANCCTHLDYDALYVSHPPSLVCKSITFSQFYSDFLFRVVLLAALQAVNARIAAENETAAAAASAAAATAVRITGTEAWVLGA